MEFITANWETIALVAVSVMAIADRIVLLTPTETDNKILASIRKVFKVVGLVPEDNKGAKSNTEDSVSGVDRI